MSSYMLDSRRDRQRPPPYVVAQDPSSSSSSSTPSSSTPMTKPFHQSPPIPVQHTVSLQTAPPILDEPDSFVAESQQIVLPKVGQTRCYWALMTSDLQFIYLDPVLCYHLLDQHDTLIGKSLLSFVHPDEQASAKRDLGSVLENRNLYGSVTRVRFARLSSVRRQLGYHGPPPDWAEAEKIVHDELYMAVDIVINWAADGLVLCFLHASVDINVVADNDEYLKTGWTNWCGTPWFPKEQIEILHRRLLVCAPPTESVSRVFQILKNEQERPLLLSWPPDSPHGPSSRDFAKLVETAQISAGVPGGSDAKTSCTRRYKALRDLPAVFGCQVESIYIPHGTIIFACHKVKPRSTTANTSSEMNQVDYGTAHYVGAHHSAYYDHGSTYSVPSHISSHDAAYSHGFTTQQHPGVQSAYPSQRWSQPSLSSNVHIRSTDPYPVASPSHASQPSWSSNSPSPPYNDNAPSPSFDRPTSPNYSTYSSTTGSGITAPLPADVVPPPRRRINSAATGKDSTGPIRSSSNRPSGVTRCSSCKTTSSPEWRKGPSGKKELCNACGLRYARSRAKKEGHAPSQSRRRKDKGTVADPIKRESNTPPSAPTYSVARRGYTSSVSTTTPTNDVYSTQPANQVLSSDGTPSPSPPASAVGLSQYSGHDGRPHYPHNSASYYPTSAPSPLSNVHSVPHPDSPQLPRYHYPSHMQEPPTPISASTAHPPSHAHHHQQLPPLQQLSSYVTKVTSSITHHSSNHAAQSSISIPSYERGDRMGAPYAEREVHLPLTPLSAEPRSAYPSRRTLLATQQ